jgi:5-methylcytosine-specific restriction endonuclease McrA
MASIRAKLSPEPPSEAPPAPVSDTVDAGIKKKKEKIPAHIKTIVWAKYIGSSIPEAKCYCCKHERIEIRSFECGHVIAEANGGELVVDNLRPICKGCNGGMGTMSMDEYAKKFFGWSVIVESDLLSIPVESASVPTKEIDLFADLLQF